MSSDDSAEVERLKAKLNDYALALTIARRALMDTNGMLVVDQTAPGEKRRIDNSDELAAINSLGL
jgi:hypothetical protein